MKNISKGPGSKSPSSRKSFAEGELRLRRLVLERLMRYYRFLSKSSDTNSAPTVTSAQIAEALDIDATQVRKDFAAIGLRGMGKVGFDVFEVCRSIKIVLGFDKQYEAVLVGAGQLGSALLAYSGFETYGLNFVAAFDNDKNKIGKKIAGCKIRPMKGMKPFVKSRMIRLAILTTPVDVSQKLVDRLVSAGVKAIWNFTPTLLAAPSSVLVRDEHISLGLSEITHHLKE